MTVNADTAKVALPAGEFERIFREAGVLTEELNNAKSARSKATQMGNFLAQHVGREVPINVKGRTGRAKLCTTQGRGRQKLYYFQVRWDDQHAASQTAPGGKNLENVDGLNLPVGDAAGIHNPDSDAANLHNAGEGNAEEW